MKNYYIEINGQHSQPLTFEKLKSQNINLDTLVWFEGMDNWTKAGNIPELAELFRTIPPPIQKAATPPPTPTPTYQAPLQSSGSGMLKKILIGGFMIAVLVILVFSFSNDDRATMQNQTEQNTQQLEEQQRLIDEQNAKIAEQERIEKERQIKELNEQLVIAYDNVEKAKQGVNDASAFELLRSRSERNEQINAANDVLDSWENEVKRLENELQKLNASL